MTIHLKLLYMYQLGYPIHRTRNYSIMKLSQQVQRWARRMGNDKRKYTEWELRQGKNNWTERNGRVVKILTELIKENNMNPLLRGIYILYTAENNHKFNDDYDAYDVLVEVMNDHRLNNRWIIPVGVLREKKEVFVRELIKRGS